MRKYITVPNTIYFICMSFLLNSYLLAKAVPLTLLLIIPLFLWVNLLAGIRPKGTRK